LIDKQEYIVQKYNVQKLSVGNTKTRKVG